jgi:hypothetical protein
VFRGSNVTPAVDSGRPLPDPLGAIFVQHFAAPLQHTHGSDALRRVVEVGVEQTRRLILRALGQMHAPGRGSS